MHEYLRRINKAFNKGLIDDRTRTQHCTVAHCDHCGIYSDSFCDCDPVIAIETDKGTVSILKDGSLEAKDFS